MLITYKRQVIRGTHDRKAGLGKPGEGCGNCPALVDAAALRKWRVLCTIEHQPVAGQEIESNAL